MFNQMQRFEVKGEDILSYYYKRRILITLLISCILLLSFRDHTSSTKYLQQRNSSYKSIIKFS